MARVASCPQCDHELIVPSEATTEAWAKCPECRAFFQVSQATSRELPTAMLVESHEASSIDNEPELQLGDEPLAEQTSPAAADNIISGFAPTDADDINLDLDDEAAELTSDEADEATAPTQSGDELDAAAQRIDEWFRSAKTLPDNPPITEESSVSPRMDESDDLLAEMPPASTSARTNATIDIDSFDSDELAGMADFDLDEPSDQPHPIKPSEPMSWDDSERMEDMLSDIEPASEAEFVAAVSHDESDEVAVEPPIERAERPASSMFDDDETPEITPTKERKPRKRSLVRSLLLAVAAGLFGLAAGYYVLLWMYGPNGDIFQVAQYMPKAILPASFQGSVMQVSPPPNIIAQTEANQPEEPQDLAPAVDDAAEPMPAETATAEADAQGATDAAPADTLAADPTDPTSEVQTSFTETEPAAAADATSIGDRYAASDTQTDAATEPNLDTAPTDMTVEKPETADLAASDPSMEQSAGQDTADLGTPTETSDAAALDSIDTESTPVPADATSPGASEVDPLFDTPATTELAETTTVEIQGAPEFTADDLRTALAAAASAQPQLVSGNFADGKEVKQAKGRAFATLADLAQKTLFARDSQGSQLAADAHELFAKTLAEPHTRGEVAQIVPLWLGSSQRKHGGVFFGGTVAEPQLAGSVVEVQIDLGDGKPLTVLAPANAAEQLNASTTVAVVGWIIDAPQTQVSGYTGNAERAIWTERLIPLQ